MNNCPCGSDRSLNECCGPIIHDGTPAPTAEALMRSRYSAHVLGVWDYLETSTHPTMRGDLSVKEIQEWSSQMNWTKLEILATSKGTQNDDAGEVEFSAHYSISGVPQELRELSYFKKEDDHWYYVEGIVKGQDTVRREAPKVGRNEPCPCGSGKKFKKCCA